VSRRTTYGVLFRAAAYLDEHPTATANEVVRAIGCRRKNALAAVRALRTFMAEDTVSPPPGSRNRFPYRRNRLPEYRFDGEDDPDAELDRVRRKLAAWEARDRTKQRAARPSSE
jgi:hypothetical protein